MLLAVAGAGLFARAADFADCLIAMGLIGVGCAPVLMASLYLFGRTYPPERSAMMSSLVMEPRARSAISLGATPLALAIAAFGWRASMAGVAVLTAGEVLLRIKRLCATRPRSLAARPRPDCRGLATIAS